MIKWGKAYSVSAFVLIRIKVRYFMKKIEFMIDATKFTSRTSAHTEMKKVFEGYEYYGNSLDALHDVLTSVRCDAVIYVAGLEDAKENIGQYAERLKEVFYESALENPHLSITFL